MTETPTASRRLAQLARATAAALLLTAAAAASPARGAIPTLDAPSAAAIGTSFSLDVTLTAAIATSTVEQGDIVVTPSCGSLAIQPVECFSSDPGVLAIAATAVGVSGADSCTTQTYGVTPLLGDPDGRVVVASQAALVIPAGQSCTIRLTATVARMPAIDSDALAAGLQTTAAVEAVTTEEGEPPITTTVSDDAQITVLRASPTVATTASPSVQIGGRASGSAVVAGRADPRPGATVAFLLFGPDDATCSGPPAFGSVVALSAAGTASSGPFTPTAVGTYRWVAQASEDAANLPAVSPCDAPGASVTVTRATPAITTTASPGVAVGGAIRDSAVVTGRGAPLPGASVTFRLHGPADPSCGGPPLLTSTVALDAAGRATSRPFTTTRAGTHRWTASYSGDANNAPATSGCGAPGESVSVAAAGRPVIASARLQAPAVVGRAATLVLRTLDRGQPVSGVQVGFGEPRARVGLSACRLPAFGLLTGSARTLRLPFAFRRAGRHRIAIDALAGGCADATRRTRTTIDVDVAPAPLATAAARTAAVAKDAPTAARDAAARRCGAALLTPSATSRPRVAAAILCLVNAERRRLGRRALRPSPRLALAASRHSADMVRRRYFAHARAGGPTFPTRLRRARYRGGAAAENIGYGSAFTATLMVRAWMGSPGHRANILHPQMRFAGVGIATSVPVAPQRPGSTYTMVFGSSLR